VRHLFGPHNLLGILVFGYVGPRALTWLGWYNVRVCRQTPELPFKGLFQQRSSSLGPKGHICISPMSFGLPWAQFHKTWYGCVGWPWNCPWGVHFGEVKFCQGQGHWRSKSTLKKQLSTHMYVDSRLARSNLASTLLYTRKLSPKQGNHVLDSIALFVFMPPGY
jgi:hypothetical protein